MIEKLPEFDSCQKLIHILAYNWLSARLKTFYTAGIRTLSVIQERNQLITKTPMKDQINATNESSQISATVNPQITSVCSIQKTKYIMGFRFLHISHMVMDFE